MRGRLFLHFDNKLELYLLVKNKSGFFHFENKVEMLGKKVEMKRIKLKYNFNNKECVHPWSVKVSI